MNGVEISMAGVGVPYWIERCKRFVRAVLAQRGIKNWELSILLCNDRFIADLNHRYRGVKSATDVLSFLQLKHWPAGIPGGSKRATAGDIVVSLESLARNAKENAQPEETELKRLLIHGILHLEDLDHPEVGKSEMIETQERLLSALAERKIY